MSGATSTLIGAYIASGSETSILEGGNFHDITITQNVSTGGDMALRSSAWPLPWLPTLKFPTMN
ncbi:MAG: hypothetical protein IPL49_10715 [Saprospirales bacterium]|nr:hypothetical protein [Saprospirales bacterium]